MGGWSQSAAGALRCWGLGPSIQSALLHWYRVPVSGKAARRAISSTLAPVRLAVYTDYAYHRVGDELFAERAFALFVARLAGAFDRLVLVGREAPAPVRVHYAVGAEVELVPLPYYRRLSEPWAVVRSSVLSMVRFWRALSGVDGVWLLGPHPLAIAFAVQAALRRKRVVLGVRQDTRAYVRSRHPGRPLMRLAAAVLDAIWRGLARAFPVVVVGPEIAAHYGGARSLLEITVSLVDESDLVPAEVALKRSYGDELRVISVGRLETEKNPLLLADVLARLGQDGDRWRLIVCGEGAMQAVLEARLRELGVAAQADLLGYVPFGPQLLGLYRDSHALLHVSWTEGLPQVLVEAFAVGLPVVATDVGGVAAAVGGAARLVPAGDAGAAASELRAIASDRRLRESLIRAGHDYAASRTVAAELNRLAEFLRGPASRPGDHRSPISV
jgi:glycosyltransferase involved in cell wall biosynthesis